MNIPPPKNLATLLEASSSSGEVKELPLWLAKGLKKPGFLQTEMPKAYSQRSLQKIQAGASSVPLGQRHAYFYDLGAEVSLLDNTQRGVDVINTLGDAFAERWKHIFDRFHNTGELKPARSLSSWNQRLIFWWSVSRGQGRRQVLGQAHEERTSVVP